MNEKECKRFSDYYSKEGLRQKIIKTSRTISGQVLYHILLLYLLVSDKSIPLKSRMLFMAALGYFILPTDLVSDVIPLLGFTDDIAFITYALGKASGYITPELKEKALMKAQEKMGRRPDAIID